MAAILSRPQCVNKWSLKLTVSLWCVMAPWPGLVPMMACCLKAPSHCLNQYWLTESSYLAFIWGRFEWKCWRYKKNVFLNIVRLESQPHCQGGWVHERGYQRLPFKRGSFFNLHRKPTDTVFLFATSPTDTVFMYNICCIFHSFAFVWHITYTHIDLTHWGRVTHICVSKISIIGSDNGLSPGRRQAIIWTSVGILLIGPLETNFSEIFIEIYIFSFKKRHLKMSSGKCRPFCLGLNVIINQVLMTYHEVILSTSWKTNTI